MVELVDAPVSLAAVRVFGANVTSRAFLDWLIAPHIVVPPHSTFRDVLDTTTAISTALAASGLFRAQSARIQPAEDGDPAHVDVVYDVHERGRFFVKTSTELGDGEGTAASIFFLLSLCALTPSQSLEGRLVNPFGHADVLSLNASLGTKTKRAFDASLSLPVTPALDSYAFLSLVGTERELGAQGGGGREERMALKAGLRKSALGALIPGNEIAAELAWRCIGSLSDDAGIRYPRPTSISSHVHFPSACDSLPDPLPRRPSLILIHATPSTTPSCPRRVPFSVSSTNLP